jgi:hypothetical protein
MPLQNPKSKAKQEEIAHGVIYDYVFSIFGAAVADAEVLADMIAQSFIEHKVMPLTSDAVAAICNDTWNKVLLDEITFGNLDESQLILSLILKAKGEATSARRTIGSRRRTRRDPPESAGEGDGSGTDSEDDDQSRRSGTDKSMSKSPHGSTGGVRKKMKKDRNDYSEKEHDQQVEYIWKELNKGRTIDDIISKDKQKIADMCRKDYDCVHGHLKPKRGGCKKCPNWLRHLLGQKILYDNMGPVEFPLMWDSYKTIEINSI